MASSSNDIERATSGLVIALFLSLAVLLAVIAFHFLNDLQEREAQEQGGRTAAASLVVVEE